MICNAGVADMKTMVSVREMPMDDFMHTFNLNFFCPVVMTKEALPHLEKTKGSIVQVSSIVGEEIINALIKNITRFSIISASNPCSSGGMTSAYGTSKAALNYFAKAVNRQEASNGIKINILSPGMVATPILTPWINKEKNGKLEIDEKL